MTVASDLCESATRLRLNVCAEKFDGEREVTEREDASDLVTVFYTLLEIHHLYLTEMLHKGLLVTYQVLLVQRNIYKGF